MIARREEADGAPRWTVATLLGWTEDYFRRLVIDSPRLDAEILLAFALGCARIELYTSYHKLVEPEERARFRGFVERRARREPVAYITGRREFYSLSFAVSPAVLIPRPETEHVVDRALEELKRIGEAGRPPRLLDLGTGSGNIAVAVAVNCPACLVDAVESSVPALEVARGNACAHGATERVSFYAGDWFEALPRQAGPYDVIASNPPYIAEREFGHLMEDVRRFEPREALCDLRPPELDGLGYYRVLAAGGGAWLRVGGLVVVEVGQGQSGAVADIFATSGWRTENVIRDYGGIERVIALRRG